MDWNKFFNYSRTIFWVGLVLVLYIFVILVDENTKNYRLHQKEQQLESQNKQLQGDIQDLKYKIDYYSSNNYRELIARQELGLQAPGEQVVIVPQKNGNGTTTGSSNSQPAARSKAPPKSDFQQWLEFFSGART